MSVLFGYISLMMLLIYPMRNKLTKMNGANACVNQFSSIKTIHRFCKHVILPCKDERFFKV